jgi:hypothetical protein
MKRRLLILICACCGSCAGEPELRSASLKTASLLNDYRDQLTDFAARQSVLNQANEQRLQQLASMRDQRLSEIESRKVAWDLAGDAESLRRLKIISSVTSDQILASGAVLNPAPAPAPVPKLSFDPGQVNGIIQELTALQDDVGILARAEEFLAFGNATREAASKSIQDASKKTDTAVQATKSSAAAEADVATGGSQ